MLSSHRIIFRSLFLLLLFLAEHSKAQNMADIACSEARQMLERRGEVIIRFVKPPGIANNDLATFLSIDKIMGDTVVAYANADAFERFVPLHIPFTVEPPVCKQRIAPGLKSIPVDWRNRFPSYEDYLALMDSFAQARPDLCQLMQFGTTLQGRKLLAIKISDHPTMPEREPAVLLSSTIHGDEPLGFILLLRLVEELLLEYDTRETTRLLVNELEIWINPLSNPDGTYFTSDTTIEGARRFNAANVDLNRNFPDPSDTHWESVTRQPETRAMMVFMEEMGLVLSANFHSGYEVVNYPWDTWRQLHSDDTWFRHISRHYADTAQTYGPPGYMNDEDNGITNGYAWYQVIGGRQDYANYFLRAREVTIELSTLKMPSEELIEEYWQANRRSLKQYLAQALTGISGIVTDSVTGTPLSASIWLLGSDSDSTQVFTCKEDGSFFRMSLPGIQSIRVTAHSYIPRIVPVTVSQDAYTDLSLALSRAKALSLYPNPFDDILQVYIDQAAQEMDIAFYDLTGRLVEKIVQPLNQKGLQVIVPKELPEGLFVVHLRCGTLQAQQLLLKISP
jgi:hypothetical protein